MSETARNLCFILYPESMPKNAIQMLLQESCKVAISPLHEPDKEEKKPHYHVEICYSGKKNIEDLNNEFREKYHCTYLQKVGDRNVYTRYLLHLDNPEKQQFPPGTMPNANYDLRPYMTKEVYIEDIVRDIKRRKIRDFKKLVDIYTEENKFAELEKISSKANFFIRYLQYNMLEPTEKEKEIHK